jgi:hypothetical protein
LLIAVPFDKHKPRRQYSIFPLLGGEGGLGAHDDAAVTVRAHCPRLDVFQPGTALAAGLH